MVTRWSRGGHAAGGARGLPRAAREQDQEPRGFIPVRFLMGEVPLWATNITTHSYHSRALLWQFSLNLRQSMNTFAEMVDVRLPGNGN